MSSLTTPQRPRLADLRRAAGLTQMQLAVAVNTSPAQVSDWERGRALPSSKFLRPLAESLGVTVDAVLAAAEESQVSSG
jgi:transcriptional regulator with XRE-family HTH domain